MEIGELVRTELERRLLWRMCMFCANWQGKLIEYVANDYTTRRPYVEKALVTGHDGPRWTGETWLPGRPMLGGWGSVVLLQTVGITHHVDPALITVRREISRYPDIGDIDTPISYEAVDLYCPYDCDAQGLRWWSAADGPEYEAFCPVHRRAAYELGQEVYHREDAFDGSNPEVERAATTT